MIEKCIIIFVTSLINFISGIKGLMGKEKKNGKKWCAKFFLNMRINLCISGKTFGSKQIPC
jgi:hypothetical protein